MRRRGIFSLIMTTALVAAAGWGSAFLVTSGIRALGPSVVLVEKQSEPASQKAMVLEANIVSPETTEKQPEKNQKASAQSITVMMGGDIMLDRSIRYLGEKKGYDKLFDPELISLFNTADIIAANLEGPITSYPSKTLVNGKTTELLTFTFSPKSRQALKAAGIDIVSLANNHTDNFNLLGFKETQDWLNDDGIAWFGNPWNGTTSSLMRDKPSHDKSPISTIITRNGISVAFVGYHAFQQGYDRVISEIKRVSGPDVFTIVMPHWGEEYTSKPSERMRAQARAFITAGADAVIGAHPHVIMDDEWIDGVPVMYSLGNLLFDQYGSEAVSTGQIVALNIVKDSSGTHLSTVKTYKNKLVAGKGTLLANDDDLTK